ncbi:hypothetical protein HDU76_005499 [Blyttiomyces sp. JEL0837]|nr:hypothetical protein HDU76_005499 [Blyttiomyces sp. JEL0837]
MARVKDGARRSNLPPSTVYRHLASIKHLKRCITNENAFKTMPITENELLPTKPTFFPNFVVDLEKKILLDRPLPFDPEYRDDSLTGWLEDNKQVPGASTISVGQVFTARITLDNHSSGTYFWLEKKSGGKIGVMALHVMNVRNDGEVDFSPENIIMCISRHPSRVDYFNSWRNLKSLPRGGSFVEVTFRVDLLMERHIDAPKPILDIAFFDPPQELYDSVAGLSLSLDNFDDDETIAFCGYSCNDDAVPAKLHEQYGETVSLDLLPKADKLVHGGKSLSLCKSIFAHAKSYLQVVKAGYITTVVGTLEIQACGGPYLDEDGRVKGIAIASYSDHPSSDAAATVSVDDVFETIVPVKESDDVCIPKSRNRNLSLAMSNLGVQHLLAKAGVL